LSPDPALMVIPFDDHMVHRGRGIFDTAGLVAGPEPRTSPGGGACQTCARSTGRRALLVPS
jgi:hypothetical protein